MRERSYGRADGSQVRGEEAVTAAGHTALMTAAARAGNKGPRHREQEGKVKGASLAKKQQSPQGEALIVRAGESDGERLRQEETQQKKAKKRPGEGGGGATSRREQST